MSGKFGLLIMMDALDVAGMRAELRAALETLGGIDDPPDDPGDGEYPTGHIETQTDGQGRIIVPEGTAPTELSAAIRAHFPQAIWGDAARISFYESSWNREATNDTRWRAGGACGQRYWLDPPGIWADTEYSVGYFQINICSHGESWDHWVNASNNVRKARALYDGRGGGWEDWWWTSGKLGLR